jgi:anti-repressor protein
MNDLTVFSYANTGAGVRTVVRDGEPWFVAADIAGILGYGGGARNAIARLPERMKGVEEINTPGGAQRMTVVSEAGAYRLAMRSNLPDAERFQDWIAEEVIPEIRKTGRYEVAAAAPAIPQTYADALQLAADQARQIEAQAAELAEAAPKVEAWDRLASADGDYAVATAAKILSNHPLVSIGQRRLFTLLSEMKWIYRRYEPAPHWTVYQYPVNHGWLTEKPKTHVHPRTGELVLDPPQVRVTVKGLAELQKRLTGTQGEIAA